MYGTDHFETIFVVKEYTYIYKYIYILKIIPLKILVKVSFTLFLSHYLGA